MPQNRACVCVRLRVPTAEMRANQQMSELRAPRIYDCSSPCVITLHLVLLGCMRMIACCSWRNQVCFTCWNPKCVSSRGGSGGDTRAPSDAEEENLCAKEITKLPLSTLREQWIALTKATLSALTCISRCNVSDEQRTRRTSARS